MSQIDWVLLEIERKGLITLLDFYNQRLSIEGTIPQIMGAIDQLLELLLDIDKSLEQLDDDLEASASETK